jgi:murein DD-endopeptidase MepM/ murein hydrolase activator NlpD
MLTKKPAGKIVKKITIPKIGITQPVKIRHLDVLHPEPAGIEASKINFDVFKKLKNAPNVAISVEPKDGNFLLYHPTPGFTSNETPLAQLSVLALIRNKGTVTIDLDKVILEYKKGTKTIKKSVLLPSDKLIIEPGKLKRWQNSREYHEPGDVLFLESAFPNKLFISFYFKKYSDPVKIVKNLKPYSKGFSLPFKDKDLRKNEHYLGYSMHGGGAQVFAYDLGARGYDDNAWSDLLPGKDWSKNNHYRIWGKNVYAMADGEVLHFLNDCPNNPKPVGSKDGMEKQKKDYWGSFDHGGAGNHFYIKHGDVVALYAHLQKNSLTSKFLKKGAKVKRGDLLGKAGNSGNSSGPHLHVHIKTYVSDDGVEDGYFRPLLFDNGYVIGTAKYTKPKSNVSWAKLRTQGIPGLKGKDCFIWPSETHLYCAYPTNWGEVCRFGVIASKYQEELDKVWTCGYYPVWVDAYDSGGNTFFNVIFRQSKGIQWVARHNLNSAQYQNEFNTWGKAGYRLINVNSYLLKGSVRYAAVWIKDKSVNYQAYHGKTLSWHEARFKVLSKSGWVPVNVSCVTSGGKIFVTALWEKKGTGGFYLRPVMTLQEYKAAFKQYTDKEKFKLVYLDGYIYKGKPMLSGIWYKNVKNYNSWWAKHYLNTKQFQTEYSAHLKKGFLTRCIAGYSDKGTQRFEGVWSK